MSYGENIERARVRAGLTQSKLGEAIGKDQGTVSAYENDRFRPDLDLIVLIADATGATLDELIRGTVPKAFPPTNEAARTAAKMAEALGLTESEVIIALNAVKPPRPAETQIYPPESAPRPGSSPEPLKSPKRA